MRLRITLLVLFVCTSPAAAAEIKTLKGETVKGEVVSVTAKDIAFKLENGETKTFGVKEIVFIDFGGAAKVPAEKYHNIELTDGTVLHCSELTFKGKEFIAKLPGEGGPALKVPMDVVANVLWEANIEPRRKEWATRMERKDRKNDGPGVPVPNKEPLTINVLERSILSADEKGETVSLKDSTGEVTKWALPGATNCKLVGLYFKRDRDDKALPVVCKATDLSGNTLLVAAVDAKEGGLQITLSSRVTILYKPTQLARLDYSTSNLAYLSDLTPLRVVETPQEEFGKPHRKDQSFADGNMPIRMQGQAFAKGLAMHATTELDYKLRGDYDTFQATVGFDDLIDGKNYEPVVLFVYLDNFDKEAVKFTFSRKDKEKSRPISVNVKGVQTMRIVVAPADRETPLGDMGLHLDLGDARVIK
jgi:hypothetical protein